MKLTAALLFAGLAQVDADCSECTGSDNCYTDGWAVPCSTAASQSACENDGFGSVWCAGGGPSPAPSPSPGPAPGPAPAPSPKSGGMLGAYFANWAQYHTAPYTHTAEDLAPIAPRTDFVYFGFAYFCPPSDTAQVPYWAVAPFGSCDSSNEYEIMLVEKNDGDSIKTLVSQGPKVILSIGGWNFPSSFFSKMVASSDSRSKFINSAKPFIQQNGLAGIDIDWEFPCSAARTDPVKITCDKFRSTEDEGGNCPADTQNLATFLKELRAALGSDVHISVASQAGEKNWKNMGLQEASQYVDHWNIMNYDYVVSDVPDGATMSPNAPLYTPSASGAAQMSIDYTVKGYLAEGVPKEKIMVGIPFYGHTWYAPGMSGWEEFGGQGQIQGECCGPFAQTYGAKPGKGCSQCGVMMFSEIRAAGCDTQFHDETKSDIAYCSSASADGYTEAGTWITYNSLNSIKDITQYAVDNGLAGVFAFDSSMDTLKDPNNGGEFSFELMNAMADTLAAGPSPGPAPSPSPGPAPSPTPGPAPTPGPSPSGTFKCVAR